MYDSDEADDYCQYCDNVSRGLRLQHRFSYIRGVTVLFALVLALCVLVGVVSMTFQAVQAFMRGCHDAEMACLAVSCAQLACSCVVLIVFARFLQKVVRQAEFFSRSQTKRLLIIACLNLLEVVFGLLLPTIGGANEGALEQLVAIQPTLDLRLLSFSLMFFALAGVFEYGRILQEDSDSIL